MYWGLVAHMVSEGRTAGSTSDVCIGGWLLSTTYVLIFREPEILSAKIFMKFKFCNSGRSKQYLAHILGSCACQYEC